MSGAAKFMATVARTALLGADSFDARTAVAMPEMARPNLQSGEGIFDCYFFHGSYRGIGKVTLRRGAGQGTRGGEHEPVLPVLLDLWPSLVKSFAHWGAKSIWAA